MHSGDASGVVASSFRILRQVLSRLEDETSGTIKPKELHVEIPAQRIAQAKRTAEVLGDAVYAKFPMVDGMQPMASDLTELVLNRTWRPALSITGVGGLPAARFGRQRAASVHGGEAFAARAADARRRSRAASSSSSCSRTIRRTARRSASSSRRPAAAGTRRRSRRGSSSRSTRHRSEFFGAPAAYNGEGGSIPFMGMLGEKFPGAQFLITGVLGPHSNAHGPNEFLHIPTGKRMTMCVAQRRRRSLSRGRTRPDARRRRERRTHGQGRRRLLLRLAGATPMPDFGPNRALAFVRRRRTMA